MNNSKDYKRSFNEDLESSGDDRENSGLRDSPAKGLKADKLCNLSVLEKTLPVTIITGISHYLGLKYGILPKPRWGYGVHILSSIVTSNLLVEFSLATICIARHFPELQKRLAEEQRRLLMEQSEKYRARFNKVQDEKLEWIPNETNTEESEIKDTELVLDTNINTEEFPAQTPVKKYVTYEELRRKNREAYEKNYSQAFSAYREEQNVQKVDRSKPLNTDVGKKQTQYGDTWDE